MTNATVRFLDFPVPELRFYLSNGGRVKEMRKALRRACYKRRLLVAHHLGLFLPYAIVQFHKLGVVRLELQQVRANMRYTISTDENRNVMLRISGVEDGKKVEFSGYFFQWLGRSELRVIPLSRRQQLLGSVRQRRLQRLTAIEEAYKQQHKDGRTNYTPLQKLMRKQRDAIINDHKTRSDAAKRRHERKRETKKYTLDDFPVTPGIEPAQPPARKLTIDFTGVNELDAILPRDDEDNT